MDHERLPIANRAKERLAAGNLVLCLGVRQARTPDLAMIADACGFDAFYIDMEHSTITLDTAAAIANAALGIGITPIVRVAGQAPHDAQRLLDGGALGIIYPHVGTREAALRFVAACKFPPTGHRSVAGSGPAQLYRRLPLAEVNRLGNESTLCIAMIETPEGIGANGRGRDGRRLPEFHHHHRGRVQGHAELRQAVRCQDRLGHLQPGNLVTVNAGTNRGGRASTPS